MDAGELATHPLQSNVMFQLCAGFLKIRTRRSTTGPAIFLFAFAFCALRFTCFLKCVDRSIDWLIDWLMGSLSPYERASIESLVVVVQAIRPKKSVDQSVSHAPGQTDNEPESS